MASCCAVPRTDRGLLWPLVLTLGQRELAHAHAHVVEDVRHQPRVDAAGVGHVCLASLVNIHPAH